MQKTAWVVMKCDWEDRYPLKIFLSQESAKCFEEQCQTQEADRVATTKEIPYGFSTEEVEVQES